MKNLQSLFFGTTMAAATVAAATLAASPVQAAALNGSIGLAGTAQFGNPNEMFPEETTLGFNNHFFTDKKGDFAGLTSVNIETLSLLSDGLFSTDYNYEALATFIDFGMVDLEGDGIFSQLTFDLNPGQVMRFSDPTKVGNVSIYNLEVAGVFNYEGESFDGLGFFGASRSGSPEKGYSTSYQMTLGVGNGGDISPESVPEPSTLLGLGAVFALGALSRKRC